MDADLLTAPQAAARLGISTKQIYCLVREGRIPGHRQPVGRVKILVSAADVDNYREAPPRILPSSRVVTDGGARQLIRFSVEAEARFWLKVQRGPVEECWPWLGTIHRKGYGRYTTEINGTVSSHRLAYFHARGEIPPGLNLDHLCHSQDPTCPGGPACLHRRCANPWHMEAVTASENNARRFPEHPYKCSAGHALVTENVFLRKTGWPACRACHRISQLRSLLRWAKEYGIAIPEV